ncbi:MAG TPA: hypothetical protein VF234_04520 [Limnochordia bacterium]
MTDPVHTGTEAAGRVAAALESSDPAAWRDALAQGWEQAVDGLLAREASDPAAVRRAIDALGSVTLPESVRVLHAYRQRSRLKRLRKAAGAAIGLLSRRGLDVDGILHPVALPAARQEPDPRYHAWLGTPDSGFVQSLFLPFQGPDRRRHALHALIHPVRGIEEAAFVEEISRAAFRAFGERRAHTGDDDQAWNTWVLIPISHALARFHAAQEATKAAGRPVPPAIALHGSAIPPAAEPVPESLAAASFPEAVAASRLREAELLGDAALLLNEPELRPWLAIGADAAQKLLSRLEDGSRSQLDVPRWVETDRVRRALRATIEEIFTAEVRAAACRALDDLAYIFLMTDRLEAGFRALAAARALGDDRPAGEHPLLEALLGAHLLGREQEEGADSTASEPAPRAGPGLIVPGRPASRPDDAPAGWTRRAGLLLPAGSERKEAGPVDRPAVDRTPPEVNAP